MAKRPAKKTRRTTNAAKPVKTATRPAKKKSAPAASSAHSAKPRKKKARRPRSRGRAAVSKLVTLAADPASDNLQKIDHIVVLMMENRSFDHMLGYLKLNHNFPVDGLVAGMSNTFQGQTFPIHHLNSTDLGQDQDPCHDGGCVAEQVSNGMGGFVANYARTHPADPDPGLVMGYFQQDDVPVYHTLAERFCICDRWFSSVDGATWPNRLYSLTGRAAGTKNNPTIPFFNIPSFPRHLDHRGVSWSWYAIDISTLRLVDSRYYIGHFGHFRYVDHPTRPSFLRDAAAGTLPSVSWIDPDFSDFGFSGNDDHPPADIRNGQELVLKITHAVQTSPLWNKTMLVIVYDEHGGFFDHVTPPAAADANPQFRTLGVRTPAIVISPWVQPRSVSSVVYDHTSLIKTILTRFCNDGAGNIPDMGPRVTAANHLGSLLSQAVATAPSDLSPLIATVAEWKREQFRAAFASTASVRQLPGTPSEFQAGLARARQKLKERGLPEGVV